MNYTLGWIFCALLVNFFVIIASLFFIPLFQKGFFVWITAFFVLGLALAVSAVKQRIDNKLKFFLALTGGSSAVFVASILLHNFIYALFIFLFGADFWANIGLNDEPLFFLIAIFVCPVAFLIGMVGSIVMMIKEAKK
jgi:hypothetical protein